MRQFWPHNIQDVPAHITKVAGNYPNPHRWSGKPVAAMALEPDTLEIDPATGKPAIHNFAYHVVYRWTSHYVHPTMGALENHVVQAGHDPFLVRGGNLKDMRRIATYNVACYVVNTMVSFYRCMGDPQPERVSTWSGALLKHLTYRHE